MSEEQPREKGGEFGSKVTEQDILKIFDRTGEPMTAPEIAEELPISKDTATYRLKQMEEKELVGRKKTGARSVVWWAKVAPRLDPEFAEGVEDAEPAKTQEEVKEELGIET